MRSVYLIPRDERRAGVAVESCRGQYTYTPQGKKRKPSRHGTCKHYWVDPVTGKWYEETLSAK